MTKDILYVFDKKTKKMSILGEIQSGFNMNFTIDGTKDSCSMIVMNFSDAEIEPYTICLHNKTNTWWVVSHDKVDRFMNDSGFIYIHNIELVGAIDLLNARDLTDCGFNSNRYTIGGFIYRLFSLSTFEYTFGYGNLSLQSSFLNKKVDFIKTFENYTLLSALREFLDAYNMCPKLQFSTTTSNGNVVLDYAKLYIYSKTGDITLQTFDINEFDDTRETKILDKNSFGTCVISNAENVISSKMKTYPSKGGIKASSTQWEITGENAVLRLPSKVFKGISITAHLGLEFKGFGVEETNIVYPENNYNIEKFFDKFINYVQDNSTEEEYQNFLNDFNSKKDVVKQNIIKSSRVTLYEGNGIDPSYNDGEGKIEKGPDVPYLAYATDTNETPWTRRSLIFTDKDTKNSLPKPRQGICWERGSNIISGFEGVDKFFIYSLMSTDYQIDIGTFYSYDVNENFTASLTLEPGPQQAGNPDVWTSLKLKTTSWSVTYIPMGDIKIKVDNLRNGLDMQLYNQNGRITDNVALSKLINSYSKEISSDNITRYAQYTKLSYVPKIGAFVFVNNDEYVIKNISMNCVQCETKNQEDLNYFIECEINMSKWVSTKSLMVNPNTNIRDYGIPQNYNVKRKQLYRDYYEINYGQNSDANQETPYLSPQNIFNFSHETNNLDNFIGVMKLGYEEQVEGQDYWYYQLETTNYYLDKMLYVVLDFNDNNIIGYGSQNVYSGFNVAEALNPESWTQTVNTPISYVDTIGEVKSIELLLCTQDQLAYTYEYMTSVLPVFINPNKVDLYNFSVFIPSNIYDLSILLENWSINISEENYQKDALEVPVFEYVCQIDDSEDVLIGDNILRQHDGFVYFYSYKKGTHFNQNNVNDSDNHIVATTSPLGFSLNNGCEIEYEDYYGLKLLKIKIYEKQLYLINDMEFSNSNQQNFEENYDYAFFRHAYNFRTQEEIIELMFIAKKIPYTHISNNNLLTLEINHYKLK